RLEPYDGGLAPAQRGLELVDAPIKGRELRPLDAVEIEQRTHAHEQLRDLLLDLVPARLRLLLPLFDVGKRSFVLARRTLAIVTQLLEPGAPLPLPGGERGDGPVERLGTGFGGRARGRERFRLLLRLLGLGERLLGLPDARLPRGRALGLGRPRFGVRGTSLG